MSSLLGGIVLLKNSGQNFLKINFEVIELHLTEDDFSQKKI